MIMRSMGGRALPNLDSMSAALGKGLGIIGFLRKPERVLPHSLPPMCKVQLRKKNAGTSEIQESRQMILK